MTTQIKPKPFVKWAGGKQSLSSTLCTLFPLEFNRYFEPFIGGGSVLFDLAPQTAVVGDMNEWLVDTYHAIRDDWSAVAKLLDSYENSREAFIRIRKIDPNTLSMQARAAQFIYLNKTCFRGLFRVNAKGQFNVPYGEYQRAYYDSSNLGLVQAALARVEFRKGDFELTVFDCLEGDFIYFDPPYYKLGGYSDFNRYTKGQFREQDQIRLAALCRELDNRQVKWAVSNSNTFFVQSLFEGFHFREISNRREINLQSQNRTVVELLITNYETPKHLKQLSLFA
jgi:DNA adenine methylase